MIPESLEGVWVDGRIVVEVVLDDGRVTDAAVLQGSSYLVDAALAAAGQWQFPPYRPDGRARRVRTTLTFDLAPPGLPKESKARLPVALQAAAERPVSAAAQFNAGVTAECANYLAPALAHLQRAVSLAPRWALARYALAHAYYRQNRFDDAVDECRRALELAPDFAEAALEIARARRWQKRYDDAIEAALYAAKIARTVKTRVDAFKLAESACIQGGRRAEQAEVKQQAVDAMRQFHHVVRWTWGNLPGEAFVLAGLYEELGDTAKMAASFRLVIEVAPAADLGLLSRILLAEHLVATGRGEEGREQLRELLRLVNTVASLDRGAQHFWRGCALDGLGETTAALREFRVAVRLEPDWDTARMRLGYALIKVGQVPAGVKELRRSGLVTDAEIARIAGASSATR